MILNLDKFSKSLIHLHIWELKDTKTNYFFVDYNCTTFTHFLLSVGESKLLNHDHLWITPGDVIKDGLNSGLIKNTQLTPSDHWSIKVSS